jgi:hypothetical protein
VKPAPVTETPVAAEKEKPVQAPKPAPVAEKEVKPAAPPEPPSAPPAPSAAREVEAAPEPPAPAAPKAKETAAASPEPPARVRYTETPKPAAMPAAPAAEEPGPAARTPAPPGPAGGPAAPGAAPAVLGFGDPDKTAGSAGSDSKGGGGEISSVRDYRRFLAREMKSGGGEGQYVPNLRFGDNKPQENREIMRYFGMELIAYPKNQKFYVYIDPEQGLYSRSNDFTYIHNFSSRVIFRNSPYFDSLRAEAARRVGVDASTLVVAQLLKPSSAAYIGWKERECSRRAGVALEDVDACEATFAKTPFGVWIVRIDRLLMRDGRTIQIQDFEWTKVSG